MSFTVQYIPLSKIKPDISAKMSQNIKMLRKLMWDCMYVLAVEKNSKEGNFILVNGLERYDYLRKHTNNNYAPCIIVDNKNSTEIKSIIRHLFPHLKADRMIPTSWSILRTFLKQEPRFSHLSLSQQIKVLLLVIRYKKTVVLSMRAMVDRFNK